MKAKNCYQHKLRQNPARWSIFLLVVGFLSLGCHSSLSSDAPMPSPTISNLFRRQEVIPVEAATIRADTSKDPVVSEFAPQPIAGMHGDNAQHAEDTENTENSEFAPRPIAGMHGEDAEHAEDAENTENVENAPVNPDTALSPDFSSDAREDTGESNLDPAVPTPTTPTASSEQPASEPGISSATPTIAPTPTTPTASSEQPTAEDASVTVPTNTLIEEVDTEAITHESGAENRVVPETAPGDAANPTEEAANVDASGASPDNASLVDPQAPELTATTTRLADAAGTSMPTIPQAATAVPVAPEAVPTELADEPAQPFNDTASDQTDTPTAADQSQPEGGDILETHNATRPINNPTLTNQPTPRVVSNQATSNPPATAVRPTPTSIKVADATDTNTANSIVSTWQTLTGAVHQEIDLNAAELASRQTEPQSPNISTAKPGMQANGNTPGQRRSWMLTGGILLCATILVAIPGRWVYTRWRQRKSNHA
jgi:hypothetical protein